MSDAPAQHAGATQRVGLCAHCAHGAPQPNARGSVFWRCRAADHDAALTRYPPLPVRHCHAYADRHDDPTAPG